MKLGKVALEKLKEPENSLDHWREQVKEHGPDHVRKLLEPPLPVAAVWPISARQALEEYEKEQQGQRYKEREERIARKVEVHEMLKESRKSKGGGSYEQTQLMKWQLFAAFVGIVVMIWLAFEFN